MVELQKHTEYVQNVNHDAETMRELYASAGYDTEDLAEPRNVQPSDVTEDTRVVAYTSTADGYQLVEWDAELIPHDADVFQEHKIEWPADEIQHVLKWASNSMTGAPKAEPIGYGDAFMDFYERNDRVPPNDYRQTVSRVRGMSNDFIRVKL